MAKKKTSETHSILPLIEVPAIPTMMEDNNIYNAEFTPSCIHAENTGLARFFYRYLMKKAQWSLKFTFPEQWNAQRMIDILYYFGSFTIFETPTLGVVADKSSYAGRDFWYMPKTAKIANPALKGVAISREIDKNCVVVRLNNDWGGISDIVSYYAEMMALCSSAAAVNLFNSKLSYLMGVDNEADAQTFKKAIDEVLSGQPAVAVGKNMFDETGKPKWVTFAQNLSSNYIAGDIMNDAKTWEYEFDTLIGIPNKGGDKKERQIVDEVNANNAETNALTDMWYYNISKEFEKARKMFGLSKDELNVDYRFKQEVNNEAREYIDNRIV